MIARKQVAAALAILLLLVAGCGTEVPVPTPVPAPTQAPESLAATASPDPTLAPPATHTPIPTASLPEKDEATVQSGDQAGGLSADQVATLDSLEQVDDYPLYVMHYQGDYASQSSVLRQGGPGVRMEEGTGSVLWACSLFSAMGNAENNVYGRNFDWQFSPALLLYTDPPDGYASVSMVDIEYLGFGGEAQGLDALPLQERHGLLDAPLLPFDGMNEQGLVVGMAAVPAGNMRPDPDKETTGSLGVIREMLDHAADVDEAVAILERYNIDFEGGPPLHYLVADRSGRSALVEFYRGEMQVLPNKEPWHLATNFLLSSVSGSPEGECWRYDKIETALSEAGGSLDNRAALDLLAGVAQEGTQWSVAYGPSNGTIDVVMGRQYDSPHTFHLPLANEPPPTGASAPGELSLDAPRGAPPVIDGRLAPDEWTAARKEELSDGSELLLMHDGEYLYLGIRSGRNGLGSLCVAHDDAVSVLHSSAALGTAVYKRDETDWQRIQTFDWACRETGDSQQALAARELHLQKESWLASNANMGEPTEMEYQIAMQDGGLRLAVVYLTGARYNTTTRWPEGLDDGCANLELVKGPIPSSLQFSPETWMIVTGSAAEGAEDTPVPEAAPAGGGQIAFYSERDGDSEIYLMNADGSDQWPLTDNEADDHCPAWSPDGTRLAFVSDRNDPNPKGCFPECNYEIYVMDVPAGADAGPGEQVRLTGEDASDFHPAWSPDGTQIAFVSNRDGNHNVYIMDADGGNQRRLTDDPADDMRPAWSPDGAQIAFNSERDDNWEIYVMDVDGGNQTRLTDSPEWDLFPAWSPDGAEIAFFSMRPGADRQDVYVMAVTEGAASGSEARQLTDHPMVDEDPAWSPDGSQIVFQSDRDGNFEIYVMDAGGGNQRRLTDHRAGDYWPAWRPVPSQVAPARVGAVQVPGALRMTTVYDNTAYRSGLQADWGFGAWLEYGDHVVLFDTGANGDILLSNMAELGLDPQQIEVVVLSHIHGDHTGGLQALLDTGVQPVVYVPASFPASFKDGIKAHTQLVEVSDPVEILPGMHTTGEIMSAVREQGLVVETSDGIVVITGCAHPRIARMVTVAHNIVEDEIALVVGGFHLGDARESAVRRLLLDFRDMGVRQVSPTHCTGDRAIALFAQEYGEDYVEGGVGQIYEVGQAP